MQVISPNTLEKRVVIRGPEVNKRPYWFMWKCEKDGYKKASPETVAEKIGSSEEDWVKMSRHSSCFAEFSLVTHASISPYMLSGMQSVA